MKRFAPTLSGASEQPSARALGEARSLLVEQIAENEIRSMAQSDDHRAAIQALSLRSAIAVPLMARGRPLGAFTFLVGESRRRYDAADLAVAEELAKRCALAVENSSLYADAQAALRHRDEFLAIASHELKTPLTPLQLQLHTLERNLPKLVAAEDGVASLAKKVALLRRQGDRLERLIGEMLDISRVSEGRFRLESESVDLRALVNDVITRFEESGEMARSGSKISVDAQSEIVGHWDRLRLEQVVTNLLSNALKYGEGKPVELRVTSSESSATLEVTDHGIGIEPQNLDRIFGRFERAVSVRHYGGLGLGLYIAHQIVRSMNGDIRVTSTPGRGSTFSLKLSLAAPATDSVRNVDEP
jgi:signal transduction histidine kinase